MTIKLKSKILAVTMVALMMFAGLVVMVDNESDATDASISYDLYGTGYNAQGQQGSGDTTNVTTFTKRASDVASYSASGATTWYIDSNGDLYGCGWNSNGQQGSGNTTNVNTFTKRASDVASVSCSKQTTWYIKSNGDLYGCGYGAVGQQGSGSSDVTTFTKRASNVVSVACSDVQTWYIDSNGDLYGCGAGSQGQQGSGGTYNVNTFTKRASDVKAVCIANQSVLYLTNTNELYGTGYNGNGALGTGNTTNVTTFTNMASNVVSFSASGATTWYIDSNGDLYGCGAGSQGQQGSGDTTDVTTFTKRASDVSSVASSSATTWYIDSNGDLYGCGRNSNGQQGSGDTTDVTTFTKRASDVNSVNCYTVVSTYIDNNNGLYVCGKNDYGQQGSGDTTDVTTFTKKASGVASSYVNEYTVWYMAISSATAIFESSNDSYGTVSGASISDIEPGTTATISDNMITIGETTIAATATSSDAQYTYAFTGWSIGGNAVTGTYTIDADTTFTANFSQTLNTYTVLWNNYDGTTLETDLNVSYGDTPTYDGATPTREATAQYTYAFDAWVPTIAAITGDTTYVASFTETLNTYTVTIASNDVDKGTVDVSTVSNVPYGTTVTVSGNTITIGETTITATAGATFELSGWSVSDGYVIVGDTEITANFGTPVDPNQTLLNLIPLFAILLIVMSLATVGLRMYSGDYSNVVTYVLMITVAVIVVCTLLIPTIGGS